MSGIALIRFYLVALMAWIVSQSMSGCVQLRHAVHTVNDIATAACMLFGKEHPVEFKYLVQQVAPAEAHKAGLSIRDLCAIQKVIAPFIAEQTKLENDKAASLRLQMGNPNAVAPQ